MLFAMGMPGRFTAWGFEVFRRMALFKGLSPVHVDRHDAVPVTPGGACYAQFPSRAFTDGARQPGSTLLTFIEEPEASVAYQTSAYGSSFTEAVRAVSASVALIAGAGEAPSLTLNRVSFGGTDALLRQIADHLGCDPGRGLLRRIVEEIGPAPEQESVDLSNDERLVVALVLGEGVARLQNASIVAKAIWPHSVFLSGDRPNEAATLVAEVTGASRILYYGPYFHLPRGAWHASVTLGFNKGVIGLPMVLEAFAPDLRGQARFRPRREGIFAAPFHFDLQTPENPVELRLSTEEGAIEGHLALGQVELTRLSP